MDELHQTQIKNGRTGSHRTYLYLDYSSKGPYLAIEFLQMIKVYTTSIKVLSYKGFRTMSIKKTEWYTALALKFDQTNAGLKLPNNNAASMQQGRPLARLPADTLHNQIHVLPCL